MSTKEYDNAAATWPFPVSNHKKANQLILPKKSKKETRKLLRNLDTDIVKPGKSKLKLIGRTGIIEPGGSFPTGPEFKHNFEGDLANLISLYQMDQDTGKTPMELATELVKEIEKRVVQKQH